jgi:hypothetical protein
MFRWRVSIFGKPLARPLGIITAPDDEKAATAKAIEFFGVEEALHFRVVVTKLDKAKSTHRAVTFASPPNPPKKPPAKDGLRPAKKQSLRAMGGHGAEAIGNIKPGAGDWGASEPGSLS